MATKTTVEKIQFDSCNSNYIRMAASAINETRKANGHVNQGMASARMARECEIDTDEAREYVERVVSDANDMEWNG